MSSSVWPSDYYSESFEFGRRDKHQLLVFLISPFTPENHFSNLKDFCQLVCNAIGQEFQVEIECKRVDSILSPSVIHEDIWELIRTSDAIIADITNTNGNVMFELGVSAAIRDKNHVIVIQEEEDNNHFLFDIQPARHLLYRRDGLMGSFNFYNKLKQALEFALTPSPYEPINNVLGELPFSADLSTSDSSSILIGPSNLHKRKIVDGIEFGTFYSFNSSWLSFGKNKYDNIHIKASMKITDQNPNQKSVWMGIMLRSQHFFANYGHLVYVRSDGAVIMTIPLNEYEKDNDKELGYLSSYSNGDWVDFDLFFDNNALRGNVGNVPINEPVNEMPYCYNSGKILFQTYLCRACISTISVSST